MATIEAIETDLGGRDALSTQKRMVLESIRRKLKVVLKVDEYIADGPIIRGMKRPRSIADKSKRALIPVVVQQMTVLESIRRDLVELGLNRFKKPVEDLRDYIARRSAPPDGDEQEQENAVPVKGSTL